MDEQKLIPKSELARFYANKNVLLSGGTGFLGKLIIQKLLICCPDLEGIYLIIRQKKGKGPQERLNEILENPVFDSLKKKVPDFRKKLHPINGDFLYEKLGLTTYDRKTLIEKVNIVLHTASSVTFKQTLREATRTIVRGTKELLELCKEIHHLDVVMTMSTAFSFAPLERIGEFFRDPPLKPETLMTLAEELDEDTLEKLKPGLLDKWPNSYTFAKAIMEDVVNTNRDKLPIGLYRPSIVIPTINDPLTAWTDNYNGTVGMTICMALGLIRISCVPADSKSDCVPADLCINGFLAATHDIYEKYQLERTPDNIIYNYVATKQYSVEWSTCAEYLQKYIALPDKALWKMTYMFTVCPVIYWFLMIFIEFLPALFFDIYFLAIGKKPRMFKFQFKIARLKQILSIFCVYRWKMDHDNILELWDKQNDADKKLYPFDIRTIDWPDYLKNYPTGLKQYVLQEKMDKENLERCDKKKKRLDTLHNIFMYTVYVIGALLLWKFIRVLMSTLNL